MGKWTPNYVDDVLRAKISSMVTGAIRRAAVEKETPITYENFVTELDSGDSFTTSIIDILVKEVADRRTRSNASDRKLISDRTIKSLRVLASSPRTYSSRIQARTHPRRRSFNVVADAFTGSPESDPDEEDNDFDAVVDSIAPEGTRINTELYETFVNSPWATTARRIGGSPSPVPDEWPLPPPLPSPPTSNRPWTSQSTTSTVASSNLSRQASIRRSARSRIVDFNDFTHRRRSTLRDSLAAPRSDSAEVVTEPREGLGLQSVRRFFSAPRLPRHALSTTWSDLSETLSPEPEEYIAAEPTLASWYDSLPAPSTSEEHELLLRAPRLRRGGVRAPESMLSRHVSPIPIAPTAPEAVVVPVRQDGPLTVEEPIAYPTPGSTENENLA